MNQGDDPRRAAVVSGVDVDDLAAAVRSCPAVVDLAEGEPASAATYLPGRRIVGLAVDDTRVTVQVRSRWGAPVGEVASQIRAAAGPLIGGRPLDIVVADVDDPPDDRTPPEAHPQAGRPVARRPDPPPHLTPPPILPARPDRQDVGR